MKRLLIALILCVLFPGCASVVSNTESTTYIETNPPKAQCTLHGQDFQRVLTTPNSIALPSEAAPITIACEAEGYKPTSSVMDTKSDGWIWGNIILGGVVGAVIDGARGAGFKYPPKFVVILEPEEFANIAARDTWYDARVADLKAEWVKAIKKTRSRCTGDDKDACDRQVKEAEKLRDEELASLEARRASAKVAGMTSAMQSAAPAQ